MRRRAVIFDDDNQICFFLESFFEKRNYDVFTFPYPDVCSLDLGAECLRSLDIPSSDIIISDVNMLGRNGIDFVEELIRNGRRKMHFALISGTFTDADRARAASLGCAMFEKPVDMEALTVWVEAVERATSSERNQLNGEDVA